MNIIFEVLNKYYGYTSFKEGQYEIISNILKGRDSFCILPTGGGKSICYQIPAMIFKGITIVVSPLISLMKDQVDSLNENGIVAEYINSTQSLNDINDIIKKCYEGKVKLLYIAPERLENDFFKRKLKNLNISQIAIDEAHCVSMWGHDFRKSYREIAQFINEFDKRPVITAFTATATEVVRKDVLELLGLSNPYIYIGGFDRENLNIHLYIEEDKLEFVKDIIREEEGSSGIIYCVTRKEVEGLYNYLKDLGYTVGKYHGGLKDEEKEYYQEEFLKENINLMIATNAFGMGIDKSNVRYVIHFTMPKNIESYYQEIGRAGRDGICYALYEKKEDAMIRQLEVRGIHFDHKNFKNNTWVDLEPLHKKKVKKDDPLEKEIAKIVSKKKTKVKPGYKKKRAQEVEKLKRRARRAMIQEDIRRQKKERAKQKMIEKRNGEL